MQNPMRRVERATPDFAAAQRAGLIDDAIDRCLSNEAFGMHPTGVLKGIGPLTETRLTYMDIFSVADFIRAPEEDVALAGKVATDIQRRLRDMVPRSVAA